MYEQNCREIGNSRWSWRQWICNESEQHLHQSCHVGCKHHGKQLLSFPTLSILGWVCTVGAVFQFVHVKWLARWFVLTPQVIHQNSHPICPAVVAGHMGAVKHVVTRQSSTFARPVVSDCIGNCFRLLGAIFRLLSAFFPIALNFLRLLWQSFAMAL